MNKFDRILLEFHLILVCNWHLLSRWFYFPIGFIRFQWMKLFTRKDKSHWTLNQDARYMVLLSDKGRQNYIRELEIHRNRTRCKDLKRK